MSFLGERNAIAIGIAQHLAMGGPNLLNKLSPSLLLQFAGADTLDPRITFTRTTTATRTNASGLLESVAINEPRFDYNPTTLAPLGLLIEEQRTNLQTYSEDFADAIYVKTAATVNSNAIVAPNGTLTGDKLVADATTAIHSLRIPTRIYALDSSNAIAIYAKAGELNTFSIIRNGPGGVSARFDLNTLTATVIVGSTASITAVGNNWFRCVATWVSTSSTARTHEIRLENPSGTDLFLGNNFSGMFFWGLQIEAGAFPTSYIPTVASQVTRAADVAVMTGTNFSSWYNQAEGTLYLEANMYETQFGFFRYLLALNDASGSTTNIVAFNVPTNSSNLRFIVNSAGAASASLQQSLALGSTFRVAGAYKINDFAASFNAGTPLTDTSGNTPVGVNTLVFGNVNHTTGGSSSTHYKRIAYYPRRLANSELQAITA